MLEIDDSLLQDLEAGGAVVVPSAQRATALRLAHATAQLRSGLRAWRSPAILSWSSWLERECARAVDGGASIPRVLRAAEEWLLWRDAVSEATRDTDLASSDALAESIQRSARLLHDWRIPVAVLHRAPDTESELLGRALGLFEARCKELRAIPAYRLPEWLQDCRPPHSVTFAGFTEITAARRALEERWTACGAVIRELLCEDRPGQAFIARADDADHELALAASWCRSHLEADPTRRLLVVIPDLLQRRQAVARAFGQVLTPQVVLGRSDDGAMGVFALEGGQPLPSYDLVRHALESLRILVTPSDFTALSRWLRASFFTTPGPEERARLESWLRGRTGPQTDVARLQSELETAPDTLAGAATAIRTALARALDALGQEPATPLQWSRRFSLALDALGWPGSRPLSSAEYQTRVRFAEVMNELGELGSRLGTLTAREAFLILQDLARRVTFEPATGDAAITVTDALCDPVVRYDGIWITGMHSDAWPAPVHFDPFIPLAAQRAANIPAASATGRLRQARTLLDMWQRRTEQLVVSWPRHGADCEYLPSPLLAELPGVQEWRACVQVAGGPRYALARAVRGNTILEPYDDAAGIPWPAGVGLPAGTRCIEYQSRCPFRAYAELRLACAALESPRHGVDMRDRGRLLHRALELLWSRLKNSQGLRTCEAARLQDWIEDCVRRAMAQCFTETALREQRRALARECRRAVRLITALCEVERERPEFRVKALESRRELQLAGTALDVRIDRIDELPDGTSVIFDYKTGRPQPQDWLSERISNPQLLVYLLAARPPVSAIVTVYLTAARVSFKGIADQKGRVPGVDGLKTADAATAAQAWQDQIARWRSHVEALTRDFLAGRAEVDPVEQACRTCHLHCFCRIADIAPAAEGASPDE